MTPDVSAVLVVALPGGGGLLALGPCRSYPPSVIRLRPRPDGRRDWVEGRMRFPDEEIALPLWWQGKLVPEGWLRANEALHEAGKDPGGEWCDGPLMQMCPPLADVARVAEMVVEARWGSRVVRLTRVDGRLVELEPAEVGR